jgi:transposase-like protein
MNLAQLTKLTEDQARQYIEAIRWPEGRACPHCGEINNSTELKGKSTRPGVYKCKAKACRKQFTVKVGTILEDSHIPYRHWVMAFHLLCASKKGMSAHQMHRQLGCTYKTAWFLCHRIRHALDQGAGLLSGTIEADETFVGGKPRYPEKHVPGHGRKRTKTPVAVLVERGGRARAKVAKRVTAKNLRAHMKKNVDIPASRLMSDELKSYIKIGRHFQSHGVTKHKTGQYVTDGGDTHSNTAESYFALLKRGVYGTFHHVSDQHLQKYCDEFSFRWDNRKVDDSTRRDNAVKGIEGKRLTYR